MDAWAATSLALWFAMLGALYWLVKSRARLGDGETMPSPPESFRQLSAAERRWALDLAWTPGLRTMTTLPVRTAIEKACMVALTLVGVAATGFAFLLLLLYALADHDIEAGDSPAVFLAPIIAFAIAFGCFRGAIGRRAVVHAARVADGAAKGRADRLKQLALTVLRDESTEWLEAMRTRAQAMALQEAGVAPEHAFTVLSCAAPGVARDGLPPARIGASYIFSNGSVVVVSGVVFDVKATSYSLVQADQAEPEINSSEHWATNEFFYRDIVEVNYTPEPAAGESIKGRESDLPREGTLTLGLVSGTRKEIPACRTDAAGFVALARDRVRAVRA